MVTEDNMDNVVLAPQASHLPIAELFLLLLVS